MASNRLILAVAGSGKTTKIVEACAAKNDPSKVLALTYTRTNQAILAEKLRRQGTAGRQVHVQGWFSFLISDIARPFVPVLFPGARVRGFDFDGDPQTYAAIDSYRRYFTAEGRVRRVHLAQLCFRILEAFGKPTLDRLSRLYSHIYIDEAQDLSGYDLEILRVLFDSPIDVRLVGDVRQAVLVTNERETKNKKYQYMRIWDWFLEQSEAGVLNIEQQSTTFRCPQVVADFADSLFDQSHGFERTSSERTTGPGHQGIWLVKKADVPAYLEKFSPLFLKNPSSARTEPYEFVNFKVSKGLETDHVLLWPTANIEKLLKQRKMLDVGPATHLYVAVTRARQSIAFVLDSPGDCEFPCWDPGQP